MRMGDGVRVGPGEDGSIEQQARTDRKERTMDTEIRLQQATTHQQQLRDEAAAYRLARGGQNSFGSSQPTQRFPRTIGALRRLVGSMA